MGGILLPSHHQTTLLRDAISVLQLHRRYSGHHLTRRIRVEALLKEAGKDVPDSLSPEVMRGNVHFFTSQLEFAKRLGDIAERLRFMPVESRSKALEKELDVLNKLKLGCDPTSRAGDKVSKVL